MAVNARTIPTKTKSVTNAVLQLLLAQNQHVPEQHFSKVW